GDAPRGLDRIEEPPPEDPLPKRPDRILHDQQAEESQRPRRAVVIAPQRDVGAERQLPSARVDQVRAHDAMPHLRDPRPHGAEEIMELAIPHRLYVDAGAIELGDDGLAAVIDRLRTAQAVAAVDVEAGAGAP